MSDSISTKIDKILDSDKIQDRILSKFTERLEESLSSVDTYTMEDLFLTDSAEDLFYTLFELEREEFLDELLEEYGSD